MVWNFMAFLIKKKKLHGPLLNIALKKTKSHFLFFFELTRTFVFWKLKTFEKKEKRKKKINKRDEREVFNGPCHCDARMITKSFFLPQKIKIIIGVWHDIITLSLISHIYCRYFQCVTILLTGPMRNCSILRPHTILLVIHIPYFWLRTVKTWTLNFFPKSVSQVDDRTSFSILF